MNKIVKVEDKSHFGHEKKEPSRELRGKTQEDTNGSHTREATSASSVRRLWPFRRAMTCLRP